MKKIKKILLTIFIVLFMFGFIIPMLVSAQSDILLGVGIVLIFVTIFAILNINKKAIKEFFKN